MKTSKNLTRCPKDQRSKFAETGYQAYLLRRTLKHGFPKEKTQCHIPYSQEKLEISLRSIARCEATVAFRTLKTRRIWASRHPLTTTRVWIEVPEKLCQAPALRHPLLQRAPLIELSLHFSFILWRLFYYFSVFRSEKIPFFAGPTLLTKTRKLEVKHIYLHLHLESEARILHGRSVRFWILSIRFWSFVLDDCYAGFRSHIL